MKLKITITGKVHNVGYRLFLLEEADSLLIPNFDAKNVEQNGKEALIVLVDGEEDQLEELLEVVESKIPGKAVVESIQKEEYNKRVRDIKSFRDGFNTAQLSKIAQTGLVMLDKQDTTIDNQGTMIGNQERMLGNQERMLGNQDKMLEKQDTTIGNQEKMLGNQKTMIGNQGTMIGNQERMLGNQDKMLEKQGNTVSEVRKTREELNAKVENVNSSVEKGFEESGKRIDFLREDFKDYMGPDLKRINNELSKIKRALKRAGIM